jgi:hypothetical protein
VVATGLSHDEHLWYAQGVLSVVGSPELPPLCKYLVSLVPTNCSLGEQGGSFACVLNFLMGRPRGGQCFRQSTEVLGNLPSEHCILFGFHSFEESIAELEALRRFAVAEANRRRFVASVED